MHKTHSYRTRRGRVALPYFLKHRLGDGFDAAPRPRRQPLCVSGRRPRFASPPASQAAASYLQVLSKPANSLFSRSAESSQTQNARNGSPTLAKLTKRTRIERFYDMPIVSEGRYYSLFGNMGINGGYLRESSSAVDTFRAICESEDTARCIFIAQTSKSPASRHLNNEKYSGIGKPRPQGKQPNTQSFRAPKAHRILYPKQPRRRTA